MKKLWKELIDCGNKAAGTAEKLKAEALLFDALCEISCDAYRMEFPFDGWGTSGKNTLAMEAPQKKDLKCEVFLGSGSGAFAGVLRPIGQNIVWKMYAWDRYGVFENDRLVAYVSGRPAGGVLSQTLVEGNSAKPHFILGSEDNGLLKTLLNNGEQVRISGCADTYTQNDMRGCNLVLPLKSTEEKNKKIVVCAHYDTMYNTKGAYDNGAGIVVAVETARLLQYNGIGCNVDVVLMDAEECRLEGSRHYALQADPDEIAFVINIDGIGRGDVMEVWCGPEAFERRIIELLQDNAEFPNKVYKNPPPPGSDHTPFYERGVDVCMFTVNDQDIIHTPDDDYNEDMLRNMEKMPMFIEKVINGLLL
jgi:hypothetical protein